MLFIILRFEDVTSKIADTTYGLTDKRSQIPRLSDPSISFHSPSSTSTLKSNRKDTSLGFGKDKLADSSKPSIDETKQQTATDGLSSQSQDDLVTEKNVDVLNGLVPSSSSKQDDQKETERMKKMTDLEQEKTQKTQKNVDVLNGLVPSSSSKQDDQKETERMEKMTDLEQEKTLFSENDTDTDNNPEMNDSTNVVTNKNVDILNGIASSDKKEPTKHEDGPASSSFSSEVDDENETVESDDDEEESDERVGKDGEEDPNKRDHQDTDPVLLDKQAKITNDLIYGVENRIRAMYDDPTSEKRDPNAEELQDAQKRFEDVTSKMADTTWGLTQSKRSEILRGHKKHGKNRRHNSRARGSLKSLKSSKLKKSNARQKIDKKQHPHSKALRTHFTAHPSIHKKRRKLKKNKPVKNVSERKKTGQTKQKKNQTRKVREQKARRGKANKKSTKHNQKRQRQHHKKRRTLLQKHKKSKHGKKKKRQNHQHRRKAKLRKIIHKFGSGNRPAIKNLNTKSLLNRGKKMKTLSMASMSVKRNHTYEDEDYGHDQPRHHGNGDEDSHGHHGDTHGHEEESHGHHGDTHGHEEESHGHHGDTQGHEEESHGHHGQEDTHGRDNGENSIKYKYIYKYIYTSYVQC